MKEMTFDEVGQLAAKTFEAHLSAIPVTVPFRKLVGFRIGEKCRLKRGAPMLTFNDQLSCSESMRSRPVADRMAWTLKAAKKLAMLANRRRATHVGYLPLPSSSGCECDHFGVSPVRVVAVYDIVFDTIRYSFSIIAVCAR